MGRKPHFYYTYEEDLKMYYEINEEIARRAKVMNSFDEYIPGSETSAYQHMIDEANKIAAEARKKDPECSAKIDYLLDLYSRKLAAHINKRNEIETLCPSVMIAGPSNFPNHKKEKQNIARAKNWEEYKKISGLLLQITHVRAEKKTDKHYEGWTFADGEVIVNKELNRVQIKLNVKPESTEIYKRNGFKWSPRQKVWQRLLTDNGIKAAKKVTIE